MSCWQHSGLRQLALGGGPPGTAAQLGTRGSPPTPGLGRFNQNPCLPKEPRGWTPAPLKAQLLHPMFQDLGACGASWVLSQGHKVSEPNRASAATPWTADKSCQGGRLCPRSRGSKAPHLPPCLSCLVSLGHRFGYVSVFLLNHFLEGVGRRMELEMDRNPACLAWDADISLSSFCPQ